MTITQEIIDRIKAFVLKAHELGVKTPVLLAQMDDERPIAHVGLQATNWDMPAELIEYFLEASNLEELTAAGNAIGEIVNGVP